MISRSALIWLSRQEGLKDFATRFSSFKKLTTRFVAGENIDEAVSHIRADQRRKLHGVVRSFERIGGQRRGSRSRSERVSQHPRADRRDAINSNVSIKLTQFGLGLDPELAYRNARRVVEDAHKRGNFVRVDMEDSSVTQVTIDIFKRLRAEFDLNDVGIVLQSYLRRTYADAQELVKTPGPHSHLQRRLSSSHRKSLFPTRKTSMQTTSR